jgi:protein phosphatase
LVSHIGDCRAYLLRGETLMRITEDQTLAQRMIAMGGEPEEVARFQHVLSNCLSTYDEFVEAALFHVPLRPGDRLLLCSDGLTKELSDDDLALELKASAAPTTICDRLLGLALDRGGRDNITVLVADIGPSKSASQ